jgi:glycosyltransferase involved in cell wall biosynthesis
MNWTGNVTGIALASVGAVLFALGAFLQHGAVSGAVGGSQLGWRGLLDAVRRPAWSGGLLCLAAGATLHAVALARAPIAVVQPIGVLALAVTTLLHARREGRRPDRATGSAIVACTVGIGGFVALTSATATAGIADPAQRITAGGIAAGAVALLAAASRGLRGWGRRRGVPTAAARGALLAAGAGAAYGLVSLLVRALSQDITGSASGSVGGNAPVVVGTAAAIAGALLVGGLSIQHAYAAAPPQVAVAAVTIADPLLAVGLGLTVLAEGSGISGWPAVGQALAAAVAVLGVALLAHANSRAGIRPAGQHRRNTMPTITAPAGSVTDLRPAPAHRRSRPRTYPSPATPARSAAAAGPFEPSRVVIAADTFAPDINGAAQFAVRLAAGLADRGHDVHVLCPSDAGPAFTEMSGLVTVHRVRSHRVPTHASFRFATPWHANRAVAALLEQLRPDVVHVQAHFVIGRAAAAAAGRLRIPLVATNHFMPENLFGYLHLPRLAHRAAARWAWRDLAKVFGPAAVVTAPTPRAVQLLTDNGLGRPAVAVSCGIDLDRFAGKLLHPAGAAADRPGAAQDAAPAAAPDVKTVLFVGRLDQEKRVHELLQALALLPDGPLTADIVGDGTCRHDLERLAGELGIADRVRFRGFVDDEELLDAYAGCDLFCMPGVAELQSIATMEAMAAGKPVIAADAMALPHLVHHGRNGLLYRPGDVPQLAGHLRRLVEEPGLLAGMGAASRAIIAKHAIGATLDTFERLYATAAPRPSAVALRVPALRSA